VRIAIIYDCLYPNTIGGAERWYRNLAEHLDGRHQVTYLTRQQWGKEGPETSFETVAVAPGGRLYSWTGKRRIRPPLRFGWGVFRHLLRHGREYDVVHTASFPFFSVLGAAAALRLRRSRARLVVDWHELWAREYWISYVGGVTGRVGAAVQALCVRLPDRSFTFSRLVEERLRASHHRAPIVRLTGEYVDTGREPRVEGSSPDPPVVVFAGRHVPEKHVMEIPAAIAAARGAVPGLRCRILGEGPETDALRGLVRKLGLEDVVEVPGRVSQAEVEQAIASAACLINLSEREGYGLVVIEAAAVGTPTIVVRGEENAAVELVRSGTNGFVSTSRRPAELQSLILMTVQMGEELRSSTRRWFESRREDLSIERSLVQVEASYTDD
jgi:glycosyltransferase involved in cell wall biosynthesis